MNYYHIKIRNCTVELNREKNILEFFHKESKCESIKHGGGKTGELQRNKSWRINTGMVEDNVTHSSINELNRTTAIL